MEGGEGRSVIKISGRNREGEGGKDMGDNRQGRGKECDGGKEMKKRREWPGSK